MNYDGNTQAATEKQPSQLEIIIGSLINQLERFEKSISRLSDLGNRLEDEPMLKADSEQKQMAKAPGRLSTISSLTDKFLYLNGKLDSQIQKLEKLI